MKIFIVFFIFLSFLTSNGDENNSEFSPTYIPPNINNPYEIKPNPHEKELEELERNIQQDLEIQQNQQQQKENSKNSWFYDIFKSIEDLFDSWF